ncbi:MAG: hypothetical protein ACT4OZ_05240 [Gemmatimonadota bacterium]
MVVDLAGHGRSENPRSAGGLSIVGHARRLELLLQRLAVRDPLLVGHGVAAALALRRAAPEWPAGRALLLSPRTV